MTPSQSHQVIKQLQHLIYYHLDSNLLHNALFFAGRLHGFEPKGTEAAYLLSSCHLRLGQFKAAYDYSKIAGARGVHLGCAFVFAQACLALEKYGEGITALERSKSLWLAKSSWNKCTEARRQHLPDAAAMYCLMGKLLRAHEDINRAIECFAEALKLNPFMWDAFLGLCDLGANVRISNIFKMTPEMMIASSATGSKEAIYEATDDPPPLNVSKNPPTSLPAYHDPFNISSARANGDGRGGKPALYEKLNGSTTSITPLHPHASGYEGVETPSGPTISTGYATRSRAVNGIMVDDHFAGEPPQAPTRRPRTLAGMSSDLGIDLNSRLKSSSLRSKTRFNGESEEADTNGFGLSSMVGAGITDRKRTVSGQVSQPMSSTAQARANVADANAPAPQRRSERLLNTIRPRNTRLQNQIASLSSREGLQKKAKATGTKGRAAQMGRVVSGNRKHGDPMELDGKESRAVTASTLPAPASKPVQSERSKEHEGLQLLLELFHKLGSGYFALSHYRCQEAVHIFQGITYAQRETPWVLAQIGRALYEQGSYTEAEKYYGRIRLLAPSRSEDVEFHSTVLWHLKSDIDLAFLAHEMIEADRLSPQAWCTLGNSFSLQRDHDQALKCFKRATQLDRKFAYAFTLQGHEHVANEEYDKAMVAYRNGIAAESRHYNAWYGLGKVFEKQGKYEMAEQHYRTAAGINQTNAVLVCCIGTVLEKMKRPQLALDQYARSCELAPKSALSRFKKARVLMALGYWDQALAELNVLKDIAPDEANVHFLLGKVYKTLRHRGNAIKHFTTALNLDPKASQHIKEAMEQMEDPEDDDGME